MIQTRSQTDLLFAEKCVTEVENRNKPEMAKIYGGLCHNFPILVRTCGLCQAVAFALSKSAKTDSRGQAYKLLLDHVGLLLSEKDSILTRVRDSDVTMYLQDTRRVLEAWIYFKRFAVSILNVEQGTEDKDNDE